MRPKLSKHDLPVRQLWRHHPKLPSIAGQAQGLDNLQRVEIVAEQRHDDQFQRKGQWQISAKLGMVDRHRLTIAGQTVGKHRIGNPDDKAAQRIGQGLDRSFSTRESRDACNPMTGQAEAAGRPFIQRLDANHFTDTQMLTRIPAVTRCRSHAAVKEPMNG
jgi:hypothetical protein